MKCETCGKTLTKDENERKAHLCIDCEKILETYVQLNYPEVWKEFTDSRKAFVKRKSAKTRIGQKSA